MELSKGYNLDQNRNKKILLACIGQCVHVAGTYNFMQIAQNMGYDCIFLGPAVPISKLIDEIKKN
ncbi:MAG: hypothetical protein ACTSPW_18305, partial [Promethearchaeota archaeon]